LKSQPQIQINVAYTQTFERDAYSTTKFHAFLAYQQKIAATVIRKKDVCGENLNFV